jgi:hypothetical protein
MPPLPPAPAVADQVSILEQAQRLTEIAPRLAYKTVSSIRDTLLRERLQRDAFLALARVQPKDAAELLPKVITARWLPAVHFAQALDIAAFTVRDQPELTKKLLLATAARHPSAALREYRQYIELPYGPAIRDAAKRAAAAPEADLLLLKIRQNPVVAETLPTAEILRLAAAARTEDERETALQLLRNLSWELSADPGTLRGALALLSESGAPLKVPIPVIRRALTGIDEAEDPLAEAVKAALILAASPPAVEDALPPSTLGRLLRGQRQPSEPTLAIPELFPNGLCLQRHVFHNDDDGVESYDSFLRHYANDSNWIIEKTEALVHLTGSNGTRRIEIYANIPLDLQLPANFANATQIRARQDAVTRAMKAEPTVLVHRGHDHHFEVTRKYLKSDARLVFLGSCHGMANVEDVVTRCRRAQMIATRGVGTTSVNDTFLQALNRRLLEPGDTLDWNVFWAGLQPTLGSHELFQYYVQPHKNQAARFLAAWYREALSAP